MPNPAKTGPERVRAVQRAHRAANLQPGDTLAVQAYGGREVHIEGLSIVEKGQQSYVDVRLSGSTEGGDPNFRIVNPPTLVPDPLGDIVVNGATFREDPISAIAHVIAQNGGASGRRKGRSGR